MDMCKVKYKGLSDSIFPYYSVLLSISLHNWPSYEINCYCLFSDEISLSQCAWTWSTMFFSSWKCTDQTAKCTKVRSVVSSKRKEQSIPEEKQMVTEKRRQGIRILWLKINRCAETAQHWEGTECHRMGHFSGWFYITWVSPQLKKKEVIS